MSVPNVNLSDISMVDVSDMRDRQEALMLDPGSLDPSYEYRFVQVRQENVLAKKLRGYQLVSRERDGVKVLVDAQEGDVDDTIKRGDTVLMKIKRNSLQTRRDYSAQIGRMRIDHSAQRFKEKAAAARLPSGDRVRVFDDFSSRREPGDE